MTSSQERVRSSTGRTLKILGPKLEQIASHSNHRHRKYFRHAPQIDHQRQPVLVPQHSAAMRHLRRRLIEQRVLGGRKCSDHFVRGDADAANPRAARRP